MHIGAFFFIFFLFFFLFPFPSLTSPFFFPIWCAVTLGIGGLRADFGIPSLVRCCHESLTQGVTNYKQKQTKNVVSKNGPFIPLFKHSQIYIYIKDRADKTKPHQLIDPRCLLRDRSSHYRPLEKCRVLSASAWAHRTGSLSCHLGTGMRPPLLARTQLSNHT